MMNIQSIKSTNITTPGTGAGDREFFIENGYLLVSSGLDREKDLQPLQTAYSKLLDRLLEYILEDSYASLAPSFREMDFAARFASLVGYTKGAVFHHLDPSLNVYERDYRPWQDAPSAQIPELFSLITNARILDAVENLIGEEIEATPGYHVNIKLAPRHFELARQAESDIATKVKRKMSVTRPSPFIEGFQSGKTPWHHDAYPGLGSDTCPFFVNVWVPLTNARPENSTLVVLPGSHRPAYSAFPAHREHEAVAIHAQPGDFLLMDGSLFHSSTSNKSTDSYRVAFNMRYLPTGVKCGRPFLPGFVARSRENHASELRDPVLWQNYWQAALDFYARYTPPQPNCFRLNVKQIERLEKKWEKLLPTRDSWLDLHHHGSRYRAVKSKTLWAIDHLRSRAPAIFKR